MSQLLYFTIFMEQRIGSLRNREGTRCKNQGLNCKSSNPIPQFRSNLILFGGTSISLYSLFFHNCRICLLFDKSAVSYALICAIRLRECVTQRTLISPCKETKFSPVFNYTFITTVLILPIESFAFMLF